MTDVLAMVVDGIHIPCATTTNPASGTFNAYGSGSAIGRPGNLDYNGVKFVIPEGLLSIFSYAPGSPPYSQGGYRIMINSSNPDIYKILAALSELIVYGGDDNGLTIAQKKAAFRADKLAMQCEATTDLTLSILGDESISCRKLRLLTLDTPNNWDDGHVVPEVYINGAWRLVDVPNDCYYTDGSAHLSALGLHDLGLANATRMRLAPSVAQSKNPTSGFKYRSYFESYLMGETKLTAWSTRIYQAYGWVTGADTWFLDNGMTQAQKNYITGLSSTFKIKTRAEILAQFYP